jgi:NitT/TauT family transport system substrate-binding protein
MALRFAVVLAGLLGATLAHSQDKVVLQLNWLPSGQKVAPYIGRERGLFSQRGIDLEIKRGFGSADTITKVATGAADFGYVDIANIMAADDAVVEKVKAVMSLFSKQPHAIIAMSDKGIRSLKDLKGKTIATSPFSSSNFFLPLVLAQAGVPMESVKIERVEAATLTPLLVQGRVDGAVLWSPDDAFVAPLAAKAGKKTVVVPFSETGFNMYGLAVATSSQMIQTKPDLVRRFVDAIHASHMIMRDDPGAGAQALAKAEPQIDAPAAKREAELTNELMFNELSRRDGFGAFNRELLKVTYDWMVKAGQIKKQRDPEVFVDRRFLPKQ